MARGRGRVAVWRRPVVHELTVENIDNGKWNVAWRNHSISNEQLISDLRRLYFPNPAMRVVWAWV